MLSPQDGNGLLVDDLSFGFPAPGGGPGDTLFDGLSFSADRGETTALFGQADAGKTTLARILVGLVPRFTGGRLSGGIAWKGADLRGKKPFEIVSDVGLVFQSSDEQIFTTRCDTEIAFALESLGIPRGDIHTRVEASLERLGLSGFRSRNPSSLSGGEKKRLLLACLEAIGPSLWILDESLEELDAGWKQKALDVMQSDGRTAIILNSRWSPLLGGRATRFSVLARGGIAGESRDPDSPGFQTCLAEEGIVARGRPASLDRPRESPRVLLKAENIEYRFPGPDGFSLSIGSLEIEKSRICALVGRNGSGKSTLARVLCGLLRPQGGTISVLSDRGFRTAASEDLNSRVGYLFQNPDHQIYLPTVFDELSLGLRRRGMSRGDLEKRVDEAIELFGLPDPSSPPALMSYGGRRRLQAAIYHLLERDLLILDEVDSGLSCREVVSLLEALLARSPGIVLITHDLELARSVADRILLLERGLLVEDAQAARFAQLDLRLGDQQ